jgi:predicted NBD/HSP70 family sugar kinase
MVLNVIRERQPVSRSDIAELIGLEGSTVSKIVSRLVDDKLVFEEGLGESSSQGGRKKRFLHLNPRKASAIGVDLRPSGYTVALSDFTGCILRSIELPARSSPQAATADLARAIRRLLRSLSGENIEGIGVSLVGLVDPKDGRILAGEALGWGDDVPVGGMLRESLHMDLPIYFENGAWLGALAEIWFGKHARHTRDLVFLDIAEGIGSGIIVNGQLYHGSLHGAGEFGHIPLHPDGPTCSCGGRGCLEAYAADPVTIKRYTELSRSRGKQKETAVSIETVVAQALQGGADAVAALRETATYLGRGLVPVIYSLNPEVIVLGGTITRAWEIIHPVMRKELSERASRFYLDHLTLIPTTLEARPSLVGAIALVLARSFSVPSIVTGDHE